MTDSPLDRFRIGTTSPAGSGQKRSGLRDHDRWVSVAMEFRCNLRCTHCMIEGAMSRLQGASDAEFSAVLDRQAAERPWDGLVLTGAEITLRHDLARIVARARGAGFAHVRVQTHGMQLHRRDYLDRLVAAGVDEFFISVTAATGPRHDAITKVPGSWRRMRTGLDLIEAHHPGVQVITNTVITAESVDDLPGIVAAFGGYACIVQHEFWNYFPMSEIDGKALCVPLADVLPPLRTAIAAARTLGRHVEVKNIPECLLGDDAPLLVNTQPLLVIDPQFWTDFDLNDFYRCPHRGLCTSTECLGLTAAYIRRFGDEGALLRPLRAPIAGRARQEIR
ncbi:radical SAM family protein [Cereibacter ovatus]|uniref:Radical SAM family protein n=1 Tax=Cereibacter ovatus TaxID=439529 RepID=A0A285D3S3_9RHOB|nr:radical SAM protein [Cereibacter ovatus]SNX73966.1 radical SAM family protein [Cereibacter ovatus]